MSNYHKTIDMLAESDFLSPHASVVGADAYLSQLSKKFPPNVSGVILNYLGAADCKAYVQILRSAQITSTWKEKFALSIEDKDSESVHALKSKAFFISGIYTVEPLTDNDILGSLQIDEINRENAILQKLLTRSPNILCFGLIRGEKGIKEAVDLGRLLQGREAVNKVIIAGKIMDSFSVFRNIMFWIFDIKDGRKGGLNETVKEVSVRMLGSQINLNQDGIRLDNFASDHFDGDQSKYNLFCQEIYYALQNKHKDKGKNIEIYFDANEQVVRQIGLKCSYAMKLDHKGMANNASTIASCFGLYLPTFTASGLVTGDEFRTKHHTCNPDSRKHLSAKYAEAVIMPAKNYYLANRNHDGVEIRPTNLTADQINNHIQREEHEIYSSRLKVLRQLYNEGIFKASFVASQLIENIDRILLGTHAGIASHKQSLVTGGRGK